MNADITDTISNCGACQQYKNRQGTEPLKNREITDKTWTKFRTDLLYFDLRPGQICHSKVMHQKEVTHSNRNKSRRRDLADEMVHS